jgi:ferritin-like metal-binding protein YciE
MSRPTSVRSPWQNGYAERLIGSIRCECTDHLIAFNADHLRRIFAKYAIYYNEMRTHISLGKDAPCTQDGEERRVPRSQTRVRKHREETDGHIEGLEAIFDQCGVAPRAIRCDAMDGILAEAKDVMEEIEDGQVHDAGMLAAAQTVEHYEIARYGTLIAWADQLGLKEASTLLGEILAEEKKTDQLLTRLAEANINQKAA